MSAPGMDQETGNIDFRAFVDAWFDRHSHRKPAPQMELPWFEVGEIWPPPHRPVRSRRVDSPSLRLFDLPVNGEEQAKICAGLCNTPQRGSDVTPPGEVGS
jgi:hypothetical protein